MSNRGATRQLSQSSPRADSVRVRCKEKNKKKPSANPSWTLPRVTPRRLDGNSFRRVLRERTNDEAFLPLPGIFVGGTDVTTKI